MDRHTTHHGSHVTTTTKLHQGSLASHGGGEGGGGLGRAVPRCRHIGCVMSHGAAAMSCCVRVIGTCVACVAYAGRATMTRRGGGGGHRKVCRGTCRDMGKQITHTNPLVRYAVPRSLWRA